MEQKKIELILFRQFANYLAFPVFIVDANGKLIFCNEASERILGFRFSETGEMSAVEWSTNFVPQDKNGKPLPPETSPLFIAQHDHRFAYDRFYIKNIQNELKQIELFAFPIIDQLNIFIGSGAFFQEVEET